MRTEVVTTLKRQATKLLAYFRESKEPIFITEHGQPSAYLLDVADYELMVERMKILEGIVKGELPSVKVKQWIYVASQRELFKGLCAVTP